MENQINLKKIGCSSCGAELIFDPGTQMTNCNFCGSKFEIDKAQDEEIVVPDGILPFQVTKEDYEHAVLSWLSEGDYTPDDILNSTIFDSVNGVYLPMWFFKGTYNGNWSASSGYDRLETYIAKSGNKLVERTRTVTDWRPSNGNCSGIFDCLAFAGVGKGIKNDIAIYSHGTTFNRGELKPYDSKYTLGFNLIEYTVDEIDTWETLGKAQADRYVESLTKGRIPGDRYKDFYLDVLYTKEKPLRTYVPFWITNYKYNNSEFHVYMDGTTTSRIQGVRPVDENRKKEVNKKYIPGHIGCVSSIIFFLFMAYGLKDVSKDTKSGLISGFFLVTLVLYGIGEMQKRKIIKQSKEKRQNILNNLTNGISTDELYEKTTPTTNITNKFNKKYLIVGAIVLVAIIVFAVMKLNKSENEIPVDQNEITNPAIDSNDDFIEDTISNQVVDTTSYNNQTDESLSDGTISQDNIGTLISNYYSDLNNDSFDANKYYSPEIDQFIALKNITPSELNNAIKYNNDYQNGTSTIEENSLTFDGSEEDLSFWSFWITYNCYRPSKNKNQECKIKVRIGVDNNFLIHSYKEMKVKDLKFYE